jgi:hypothetical protein
LKYKVEFNNKKANCTATTRTKVNQSDTLLFNLKDELDMGNLKPASLFSLNKKGIQSAEATEWLLNGSTRLIDVSYISESMKTEFYNIDHSYFREILERLIQEKCGQQDKTYIEKYLDSLD